MVASCCNFYWETVVDIVNQYMSPRDHNDWRGAKFESKITVKTQIKIHGCTAMTQGLLLFDCFFLCLLGNQENWYTKHMNYKGPVCSPRPLGIKEKWFTQKGSVFLYQ